MYNIFDTKYNILDILGILTGVQWGLPPSDLCFIEPKYFLTEILRLHIGAYLAPLDVATESKASLRATTDLVFN